MQNVGVFQQLLDAIAAALQPGAATVREHLVFWFGLFLWLEVLRACWVFLFNGRLLPSLAGTLLRGGLLWWALYNFPQLLEGAVALFIRLGLTAGGGRLTVTQFLDPGAYLYTGMRVASLLHDQMQSSFGLTSLGQALGYLLLWLAFMGSFAVMAINVLIWQVEMLLAGILLLLLLPTLLFRSVAWMGQGALSYVINKAFRFGVGALLASATFPVLDRLTITQPVSFRSVVVTVIGGWVFALLFWQVNKIASGFLAGMPQLTAGTVFGAAVGSAVTVGAVGAGVVGVGMGGAAAALGTGRAGLLAVHGVRGGLSGGRAALASSMNHGLLTRASTTLTGTTQGARGAIQGSPLAARLGSYAGTTTRVATQHTRQTLRQFADVARYIGQDHPGPGVRR